MAEIRGVSHLLLQTGDLARAEQFYTSVLGFHVRERSTFRDGRPLVVMREGLGLTELTEEGKRTRSKQGQALEHVAFKVVDIAALERDLRAAGVTIYDGPKPTHYGTSLYFFDPDGVHIECHDEAGAAS
jgi:catechol 2,3-dioxygenase-like lactoylglutathione lyase family enzyme